MRKCKRCGRELGDDQLTCPYCSAVEKNDAAVNSVMLDGIALRDGDETDRKYKESHASRDEPNAASSYRPTSSPWLKRASGRYEAIAWLIYLSAIPAVYCYLSSVNFAINGFNIIVCLAIIWFAVCTGLVYSAVGAHLKGMADIVDGIEELNKKK